MRTEGLIITSGTSAGSEHACYIPNLFFALGDLKEFAGLPDVFIVPSNIIATYFQAGPEGWPRARFHEAIEVLAPYKNNWETIQRQLTDQTAI